MKRITFALLISTCWLVLSAQSGFNNKYDLSLPATTFRNLMLDGDTLVLFGIGIQPNPTQQGIIFAKMDTLGNLAQTKIILNDSSKPFTVGLNYSIAKTLDDTGYAIVGESSPFSGILIKLNKNGDLLLYKEYIDSSVLVVFQRKVIELKNGFFLSGHKQKSDFSIDIYVARTDKSGNKLWEKSYGQPGVNDRLGAFIQINDNEFVIGGSRQSPQNTPIPERWARAWLFAIDSLGEVLWEFEESENLVDAGVVGLNPTPDGGWIYCSGKTEIFSANDWGSRCQIVRRDSNFNLLWMRIISPTSYSVNSMVDMKPTPDGDWVAIGRWSVTPAPGDYGYRGGSITRITTDGDTLWNRHFTAWPDNPDGSRNFLGGVVVLSSGSVVAAGYTERFAPVSVNYQGWVIKIDKDGCVDTLCITSSAPVPVEEKVEVAVYPNPASDEVTFDASGRQGEVSIQVYDHSGVRVWDCSNARGVARWRPAGVAQGFYFYRITDRNNLPIKAGTIVLAR